MGCIRAKEEKADLGPEVPEDKVFETIKGAAQDVSYADARVGQYVHYNMTRRLENEEVVQNLGSLAVSIIDKQELPDRYKFTLNIKKARRLNDGTFEQTASEEPLEVDKGLAVLSQKAAVKATATDSDKPVKTTYHRLRTSEGTAPVPAALKAKADCGGISPCELPVRYVQFDLVNWYADDSYQRIAVDLGLSSKPPYLPFGRTLIDILNGALVVECMSLLVPVEGRTVYVRDCMNLEDFQK
jgi:hypothetical protein